MSNYLGAYPFGRWIKWGLVVLLVIIIAASLFSTYNGLVEAEAKIDQAWSHVENKMQRRFDTITPMVEVAKGYMKHEEKIFGDIARARAVLQDNSQDIKSKTEADALLTSALRQLLVVVENYPELKSNQQFHDLMTAIEGSENRISVERDRFIDAVNEYNLKVKRFPGSIMARMLGFTPKEYYKADPEAQKAPEIKFD